MKSFDPIDILFISLICFYLLILISFIVIFIKLARKYDNDGNKVEDDQMIEEMNEYSDNLIKWSKGKYKNAKEFVYEKLPKKEITAKIKQNNEIKKVPIIEKESTIKSVDDLLANTTALNTEEIKNVVKKTTTKKPSTTSTTKKKNTSTKKPSTTSTTKKKNTSTKKKTTTTGSKKSTTTKKSTSTKKPSTTARKKTTTSSTKKKINTTKKVPTNK